jgi:hypothetical protein
MFAPGKMLMILAGSIDEAHFSVPKMIHKSQWKRRTDVSQGEGAGPYLPRKWESSRDSLCAPGNAGKNADS